MALETGLCGMPVLSFMRHLPLVHAYGLTTCITVLGKSGIKAMKAEGTSVPHHIPLPSKLTVTLEAAEMAHVPGTTFGFCTFISKDYLQKIRNRLILKAVHNNYTLKQKKVNLISILGFYEISFPMNLQERNTRSLKI